MDSILRTISGQEIVWISAFEIRCVSLKAHGQASRYTHVRYSQKVGIKSVHVEKPDDFKDERRHLRQVVCPEEYIKREGGSRKP